MSPLSAEAAALQVEELSVTLGQVAIVKGVTFTARAKHVTAIIGPNGAGKTTLLEALVGLRPASAGRITVGGRAPSSFRERAGLFAYLPDQGELPPELDVRTLIEHAERCGRPASITNEVVDRLSIAQLMHKPVGGLSRGERKRLELFCTLLLGRSVVVLDEPFSAFDPLQLREVLAAIRSIVESGAALIASMHQLTDAERVADEILLLAEGEAVAFGSLAELRGRAGGAGTSLEEVFVTLLSRRARVA
jgi:ABC-type multidrug transport system ATPase subunit